MNETDNMSFDEFVKTFGFSETEIKHLKTLQKNECISLADAVDELVLFITEQIKDNIDSVVDDYRQGKFNGTYITPTSKRDLYFEAQGMNKILTKILKSLNTDLIKHLKPNFFKC